ncbi:putative 1-alkyl-2-acetylglycerophosphocholine esterase [Paramyrothecium foliicola]|nr:putative 1-alkyl-2-acetylglycerophosphocholine esterase [Paramyrothecium foliicola]
MKLQLCSLTGALWLAQLAWAEPVPEPSGRYNVGVRRVAVDFINRDDPVSPNNVSTQYLATIYYPTEDEPGPPIPYLQPEEAQLFAERWNYNVSHLTTTYRWNASFLCKPAGPSLVFGPGGWGPSTDGFGILLSELASRGYAVAALDHPYEQPFVRFPNGTGVLGLPLTFSSTPQFIEAFHPVRVREVVHFVSYWPKLVAELKAPFETDKLGAIGHSFGGSVALNAAIGNDAIAAVINQDGSIFSIAASNTTAADVKKPSLLLGFENHHSGSDRSWGNYTRQQTDWWRSIYVNGTDHRDWTDQTFWKIWGTTRVLGPIDGRRMVDIRSTYVSAFFDEHLRGEDSPLMDAPSEKWPEVTVYDGNDL